MRGGKRDFFAVKYERFPDWCQVCGMMGHQFKEHGDRIHPLSAIVFKNLHALATTRWGTRQQGRGSRGSAARGGGLDAKSGDIGSEEKREELDAEMDDVDRSCKRSSDDVLP